MNIYGTTLPFKLVPPHRRQKLIPADRQIHMLHQKNQHIKLLGGEGHFLPVFGHRVALNIHLNLVILQDRRFVGMKTPQHNFNASQ